jgi:hypothetical protein
VNICPILPIENTNNILCTNYKSNRRHPPEPQTTPTSFLEYLEVNAQPWEKHLLKHIKFLTKHQNSLESNPRQGNDIFLYQTAVIPMDAATGAGL